MYSAELISAEEIRLVDTSDYDYSVWGAINCQREKDGTWRVWFVISKLGAPFIAPEVMEETKGIRGAEEFKTAFLKCGLEFGTSPDLEELASALGAIEREDEELAAGLQALLK